MSLQGGSPGADSFEGSVYARFWQEASQAVALSRKGKVHLVARVDMGVLRGLHAESTGEGESMGRMPIAVVCKDAETLGGPMLRGLMRLDAGWHMGDGSVVRFFNALPGPEEGELVEEFSVSITPDAQRDLDELQRVLQRRSAAAIKRAASDH
ncbi:MAG: hypothetical protein E6R08_00425 [Nevskiaceae bacterium]|nr:MAG: hypothetical protein E6R08_00425 [Nevskiaceae bacterium]